MLFHAKVQLLTEHPYYMQVTGQASIFTQQYSDKKFNNFQYIVNAQCI